mgnify:FL=1
MNKITTLFLISTIVIALISINNVSVILSFSVATGDLAFVAIVMSILG